MATTQDGAYLAHLADTVTALAEQLAEHREVQQNILAGPECAAGDQPGAVGNAR